METFLGLIGLFLLFVVVAAIWGFFLSLGLRDRVEKLELTNAAIKAELARLQAKPQAKASPEAKKASAAPETSEKGTQAPPSPQIASKPEDPEQKAPAEAEPIAAKTPPPLPGGAVLAIPNVAASASIEQPAAKPAPKDIENIVGARWTVWVGALALALGGVFLIRYSIEQGLFGPLARIVSGLVFSLALLAAGEFLRRKSPGLAITAAKDAPIPALLTAVATMTAFGTVFAAHALYGIIGPGFCFVALALIGLGAMVAAGLHGPWLAGLGLLGAMVSPMLVNSPSPNYWVVAVYILIVAAAGYGVASMRGWPQIGRATLAGVTLWGLILATTMAEASHFPTWFYLIAQTVLAGYIFAWRPYHAEPDASSDPAPEAHVALAILAALGLVAITHTTGSSTIPGAVMIGVLLVLAWRLPAVAGTAIMGGVILLALLTLWPSLPHPESVAGGAVLALPIPDAIGAFCAFALGLTILVAGLATLRLKHGPELPWKSAGLYALAAVLTPLTTLVLAWLRIRSFGLAPEFGAVAGALSAGMGWMALQFRKGGSTAHAIGLEAFAGASIAALSLGLTMVLDRGFLTVALALAACGAAWVTSKGPVNALRIAAGTLAAIVLERIVWDPAIMAGNPGTTPIVNWLLVGYGIPAVAFFFAARFLRPGGEDAPLRLMESMSLLFAALLVTFEIRHLIHGADLLTARTSHLELGLHVMMAAGFAAILMRIDRLDRNPVYRIGSLAFAALTLPLSVLGLFLSKNPLNVGEPVLGNAIVNSLLPGYALPALACGALYLVARNRREAWFTNGVGALALALAFAYVSLETRRLFHGADTSLRNNTTGEGELWAYSAVWLTLGIAMLAGGILRQSRTLRLLSAAFIIPSVLKVFLIDMSGLEGFWRALSFIGLGITLMGIGLVYQRFVFTKKEVVRTEE